MMILVADDSTAGLEGAAEPIDLLILGAGWSAGFLTSLIAKQPAPLRYRTTTTRGGGESAAIKFTFDPTRQQADAHTNQFASLPDARAILVSFPIKHPGASAFLLNSYARTRPPSSAPLLVHIIQLGSSGIFDGGPTLSSEAQDGPDRLEASSVWIDRHSAYDVTNARAGAEAELLGLNETSVGRVRFRTTVMNLAGLWGGERSMRKYVSRVAPSLDALRAKTSLHMIHGLDLARALLAVLAQFPKAAGQRWILTDQRVYDWWDLASAWGEASLENPSAEHTIGPQAGWVNLLMRQSNTHALPRPPIQLRRALDSREFWSTFNLTPVRARMEHIH